MIKASKSKDPQQINFDGKIDGQNNGVYKYMNNLFYNQKVRKSYFWIFAKFCKYIIKMEINETFFNEAEHINIAMHMYNLIE